LLARHAKKVIAVDTSEKMVEFGSKLAKEHGFKNLEYKLGDMQEPPIAALSMDLALFSQALHHAGSPARAVAAAYRILKKGGRVAILDLLGHNFEQAREMYADLWLGFSEVELHQMLKEAGFSQIEVTVVARDEEAPHLQTIFATAIK
jgi:ArsR family transcriptional regulator